MTVSTTQPRLSLGPVLYYWSRQELLDFYSRIADTSVDIVYLGETVCSKRRSLRSKDWLALAQKLTCAGKEVVLSTLNLIESAAELGTLKRLCSNGRFAVEANDIGAVQLLSGNFPFVAGASINIYNARTLRVLADQGLYRWVPPVELSRAALADLQRQRPDGVETEVFVYGRLPLAYSARCFTARARNLPKDDCRFSCADYPDGLELATRERESFLVLNGIQTQSARSCNLIAEVGNMASLGVEVLRISPQQQHTETIIEIFRRELSNRPSKGNAVRVVDKLTPAGSCNGYWYGVSGMDACTIAEAPWR